MCPGKNVAENETCCECLEPAVNGGPSFLRELRRTQARCLFYRHLEELGNVSVKENCKANWNEVRVKRSSEREIGAVRSYSTRIKLRCRFCLKKWEEMCGCPFHPFLFLYLFRKRFLLKANIREWTKLVQSGLIKSPPTATMFTC